MSIDSLIADLEQEGTVDSHGGFTLDRAKAREKMRQFQLADPREYLLHLVRTASLMGATRIAIDVDADDMHFRFDGQTFNATDFEELYDALFGRADDPSVAARRHLALGLNAALGLNPRRIDVRSGAARLQVAPGVDDDFGPLDPPIDGTWIHARDRLRFANLLRFFQNLGDGLPEAQLVRERCLFSPIDLIVNGVAVPDGAAQIEARTQGFNRLEIDGLIACGGLADPAVSGQLRLIVGGVQITTLDCPDMPGFVGAALGQTLKTDISQANVVQDGTYTQLLALAESVRVEALRRAPTDALLQAELQRADWNELTERYGDALARRMQGYLIGETLAGRPIRVSDCVSPVSVVRATYAERARALGIDPPQPFASMLLLPEPTEPPRWLAQNMVDRTADWAEHLRCLEGKRDFERRYTSPTLRGSNFRMQRSIGSGEWVGEIGILEMGPQYARAWWLLDGRLLGVQPFASPIPGVQVVLDGPFQPNADYSKPLNDAVLAAAAHIVGTALEVLVGDLPTGPANDGLVLRWLRAGVKANPVQRIADAITDFETRADRSWRLTVNALPTAITQRPLFETTGGGHITLATLAQMPLVDAVGIGTDGPPLDPPILRLTPADKKLLQTLLGPTALRSGRHRLQLAKKRARFEQLPPRAPDLRFVTAHIANQIRFEHGVLGLCTHANAGGRVQPFIGGRPVRTENLALPLPGLVAALEVGEQPLNESFNALRELPVAQIMAYIAPQIDRLFIQAAEGPARRAWRALIDLLIPTDAWAKAWMQRSPQDYRNALRATWRTPQGDSVSVPQDPGAQPPDPIADPLVAAFFEAEGDLATRLCTAYPHLCAAPLFRRLGGSAVSFEEVMLAIESDGVILHASRASAVPSFFEGMALRTEHAQLERLTRCFGADAIERATAWGTEHALKAALTRAPQDPGGLPEGTRGIVPIEGGQVGFAQPFDPDAATRITVVLNDRVVAVLQPRLPLPMVGYVRPSGETRLMLRRGGLAIDDLARVRIGAQARQAVKPALETLFAAPDPTIILAALATFARGLRGRRALERSPFTSRLADLPIFPRLDAPPATLFDIVDRRRRRDAIWVTDNDAVKRALPTDWVLVLDVDHRGQLESLLKTELPDYTDALQANQRAAAFLKQPAHACDLPDAAHKVRVNEDELTGWIGWGGATDSLVVLRAHRLLDTTTLRLGFAHVSGIINDPLAPHTANWDGLLETPRVRRLRRIVAGGVPALGAVLAQNNLSAARDLAWSLVRAAVPNPHWVKLFAWLQANQQPRMAEATWRDALRAAYQNAPRILNQELRDVPISIPKLLDHDRPTGGGADALVRAAFGGQWPLTGTGDALERLVEQLGPLAQVPLFADPNSASLRDLSTWSGLQPQDLPALAPADHALLFALLGQRTQAAQAAEAKRQTRIQARETERQARAEAAARRARIAEAQRIEAERRAAEIRRLDAERRAAEAQRLEEEAIAAEKAAEKAAAQQAADAEEARQLAAAFTGQRPPDPDEQTALIQRVRAILEALRSDHPRLLAEVNLERVQLRETGPLAHADNQGVSINSAHPVAQAALAGTTIADAMVASAVYTALNLWLDDITDAHEVRFVAWMRPHHG